VGEGGGGGGGGGTSCRSRKAVSAQLKIKWQIARPTREIRPKLFRGE